MNLRDFVLYVWRVHELVAYITNCITTNKNMNMKVVAYMLLFQVKTQYKRLCDLLWT